jgi:hypothetical protein
MNSEIYRIAIPLPILFQNFSSLPRKSLLNKCPNLSDLQTKINGATRMLYRWKLILLDKNNMTSQKAAMPTSASSRVTINLIFQVTYL